MSHSNTQRLTDYWRDRRGLRLAPLRSSVDPCDFADLLPQVFILGRLAAGRYAFRLRGALLEDLHGRDLKPVDFMSLWSATDRISLHAAMEGAIRNGQALIVEARGVTESGHSADFEVILAPMISHTDQVDRFLGLLQPVTPLQRLQGETITRLNVIQTQVASDSNSGSAPRLLPSLRLASVDGRRIA